MSEETGLEQSRAVSSRLGMSRINPFRYFKTPREVIRLPFAGSRP
ncbi:hypothetical protein [Oricola indica]